LDAGQGSSRVVDDIWATVEVTDEAIRLDWKKNQQYYAAQVTEQTTWEIP